MTYTKLTAAQSEDLLKRATARAAAKNAGNTTKQLLVDTKENTTKYITIDGIRHEVIDSEYNPANKTQKGRSPKTSPKVSVATRIFAGIVATSFLCFLLTLVSTFGFLGAILIYAGGSFLLGCLNVFLPAVLSLMAF